MVSGHAGAFGVGCRIRESHAATFGGVALVRAVCRLDFWFLIVWISCDLSETRRWKSLWSPLRLAPLRAARVMHRRLPNRLPVVLQQPTHQRLALPW